MARQPGPGKEPTIREVARAAGVSPATAGRALGDYGAVSDAARERILAAAASLGYRPNSLARSMITGTTHTLGVVVADIENPFFARAVRGIADVAHAQGFEVVLANSDEDLDKERGAVRVLSQKRIDGLIIAPAAVEHGEHLAELVARGLPLVQIDRYVNGLAADAVVTDNRAAARNAVGHLVALGHRRIAVVTGGPKPGSRRRPKATDSAAGSSPTAEYLITSTIDRLAGYRDALEAAELPVSNELVRHVRYSREAEAALEATREVLQLPEPATALFTTDNFMTLGAYEGIRSAGCSIPNDVSLVGFDDLDWTAIVDPPLTVVAQPTYDLGATAATRLLARIGGDRQAPFQSVLETKLQLRQSTTLAPA